MIERFFVVTVCAVSLAGCGETSTKTPLQDALAFCDTVLRGTPSTRGGQAYARNDMIIKETWSECGTARPALPPALPLGDSHNSYYHHPYRPRVRQQHDQSEECVWPYQLPSGEWRCY
jgi:hypothetical protein